MKRVKLFLSAIAVLAIVSGALAFKASHKFTQIWCSDLPDAIGLQCDLIDNSTYIPGTLPTYDSYCTDKDPGTTKPCPERSTLSFEL